MDHRLVQTAVSGAPDSLDPVIMPLAYEVAMGLRLTHGGRTFWCGTWLGGCGGRLMTRIGKRKVPHFAHYPDMAGRCRRRDLDDASADHLFIHRDLKSWLGGQGIAVRRPRLLGDVDRQGTCSGLLLETRDGARTIAVVLNDRDAAEWKRLYEDFRKSARPVDWLYSPATFEGRAIARGQGNGLLAMCHYAGGERRLRVGAPTATSGRVAWVDLADCRITGVGITHPAAAASAPGDRSKGLEKRTDGQVAKAKPRRAATPRSSGARTLGEEVRKEFEVRELLDKAFLAMRDGNLKAARALQEEAADTLSGIPTADADLHRRSRSCAAQILDREQRQANYQPVRPFVAGRPLKAGAGTARPRPQVGPANAPRHDEDGATATQVAIMKNRLRAIRPSKRLLRDLNKLLHSMPGNGYEEERREFESYLNEHWPKSRAVPSPVAAPRAACSCGWKGKAGRFARHTMSPASHEKTHKRLA